MGNDETMIDEMTSNGSIFPKTIRLYFLCFMDNRKEQVLPNYCVSVSCKEIRKCNK